MWQGRRRNRTISVLVSVANLVRICLFKCSCDADLNVFNSIRSIKTGFCFCSKNRTSAWFACWFCFCPSNMLVFVSDDIAFAWPPARGRPRFRTGSCDPIGAPLKYVVPDMSGYFPSVAELPAATPERPRVGRTWVIFIEILILSIEYACFCLWWYCLCLTASPGLQYNFNTDPCRPGSTSLL